MNKRINFKEIKQGVGGYKVTVGSISKIMFLSKPYLRGVGSYKSYAVDIRTYYDDTFYDSYEFLYDKNIVTPRNGIKAGETNCIFRSKKAAEKYVRDTKQNVKDHFQRMRDWDKELRDMGLHSDYDC